ncbi:hypothetical protein D9M69_488860 [compost metagenome]
MAAACSAGVPSGSAGTDACACSPLPIGAVPTPGPVCGYAVPALRPRAGRVTDDAGTTSGLAVMAAWIWLTAA